MGTKRLDGSRVSTASTICAVARSLGLPARDPEVVRDPRDVAVADALGVGCEIQDPSKSAPGAWTNVDF